jgi:hypothetical protein
MERTDNYSSDLIGLTYSVWEPLSCNAETEYEIGFHGMM